MDELDSNGQILFMDADKTIALVRHPEDMTLEKYLFTKGYDVEHSAPYPKTNTFLCILIDLLPES